MGSSLKAYCIFVIVAFLGIGLASCEGGPASPESQSQRIVLSASVLDFAESQDERDLRVTNTQDLRIDWFVKSTNASWVAVTPSSGALEAGASQTLVVRIDRSRLAEGTNTTSIEFEGGGRSVVLAVTVEHDGRAGNDNDGTPRASLEPGALSLGPDDASDVIEVVNSGSAPLDWSMTGPEWASIDPASGRVPAGERSEVIVTPDRSGLSLGVHQGTLSLASNGGSSTASLSVEVSAVAGLRLDPTTLDFGSSNQQMVIQVINDGDHAVNWSGDPGPDWISLSPSTGNVAAHSVQAVSVKVSRAGLSTGAHQAAVRFTSNGGSAAARVHVSVPAPADSPAVLSLLQSSLNFGETKTELSLRIANQGGQPLNWSASPGTSWVKLSSSSGQIPANGSEDVRVRVSRSSLSSGKHKTTISITSNGGDAPVEVSLAVPSPPDSSPPPETPPDSSPPPDSPDSPDDDDDGSGDPTLADIDATGRTDVTKELNAYIASVPDGSVITFPAGARYRVEGIFLLVERNDLTIEGNGAMIFAETDGGGVRPPEGRGHLWPRQRSHVDIERSQNIVIRNLVVRGANPNAGSGDGAYVVDLEGQHGFDLRGVQGVTLENVTATDVYGDFVYLGPKSRQWSTDVRIIGGHFERSGRQGFAISGASNVVVQGAYIGEVGRTIIDIEPLGPGWGAHDITFRGNTFGFCRHLWVSSGGLGGNVDGILFENNRLVGMAMKVKVQDSGGDGRRGTHAFIGNVSDTIYPSPSAAFEFKGIDGVTVIGNVHEPGARERDRSVDALVYACNSTSVDVHDNDFRGFSEGELVAEKTCR